MTNSTNPAPDLLDQVLAVYDSPQVAALGEQVDRATEELPEESVHNLAQFHHRLGSWVRLLRAQGVGLTGGATMSDTAAVTAWVDANYTGVTGEYVGALTDALAPEVGIEAVMRCLADTLKAQLAANHIQARFIMECGLHDYRQQQRLVEQIVDRFGHFLLPSVRQIPIEHLASRWRVLLETVIEAESQFRRNVRGEPMSI